jgi:hypothetical protein
MASAALIDDRLQIDGLDMYTWTNTFGIPTDGFSKGTFMDGSYMRGTDENPMALQDANPALDHFDPLRLNMSGPMYLKETSVNPAPDRMYPARKFEYEDGTVTWDRPGRSLSAPRTSHIKKDWVLIAIVALIILFLARKTLLKSLKS